MTRPKLREPFASGALSARRAFRVGLVKDQHVFVNRRPVENRGLNFALLEGYHTSLMKGRYPGLLPVRGDQPCRGGREHSSCKARGEIPS